jgi:hypothetical protein
MAAQTGAQVATPVTQPGASSKSVNTSAPAGMQAMQMVDSGQVQGGEDVGDVSKAPSKSRAPKTPDMSGQTSVEAKTGPDWADLESIFDIQEESAVAEDPVSEPSIEDDSGVEEEVHQGSRAEKRIRSLVSQKKELADRFTQASQRIQQYEQWAQQVQQYNSQVQQRMQQQAIQLAKLEATLQYRGQPQQAEEQDPVARFKNTFAKEVLGKAKQELDPEVRAVRERLDRFEQSQKQQQEAYLQAQRKAMYSAETDKAVKTHITSLLHPEDADTLSSQLGDYVLLAAMLGDGRQAISFDDAAKKMQGLILKTAKSLVRARTQKIAPKVEGSQQAPTTIPRGRSGTKAESTEPDWATKSVQDFKKFVQRDMSGRR